VDPKFILLDRPPIGKPTENVALLPRRADARDVTRREGLSALCLLDGAFLTRQLACSLSSFLTGRDVASRREQNSEATVHGAR
jgi:hypothetical protein